MERITNYFEDFTETQLKQLEQLDNLYRDWNSRINVISRKDIDSLYEKHVLHSLSIAAVFEFKSGSEIIDIGTGGGFPGIPLAIFFPEIRFYLVDSIAKKLNVVKAIATEIGLKNVTTQHTRVEEINKPGSILKNKKFDFAVSRAVAPLKDLWKWSKPLLKSKAQQPGSNEVNPGLICLKGGDLAREINESGTRPRIIEIANLFQEEYFREKFLLYIPR